MAKAPQAGRLGKGLNASICISIFILQMGKLRPGWNLDQPKVKRRRSGGRMRISEPHFCHLPLCTAEALTQFTCITVERQ